MRLASLLIVGSALLLAGAKRAHAYEGFRLAGPEPWGLSLEGYAGLLLQATRGEDRPHGLGGGQLRVRYRYFQAGLFVDTTDTGEARGLRETSQERFRTVGVFAGAWLPFTNWVDLDASVGAGSRLYRNPIPLYGPDGMRETMPAVTWRLGVSDRLSEAALGLRVGAAVFGSVDLDARDVTFYRRYLRKDGTLAQTTGTTPIGGVSAGLLVTLGFDYLP